MSRWLVRLRWVVLGAWVVVAGAVWLFLPSLPSAGSGSAFGGAIPTDAQPLQVQKQAVDEFGLPVLSRTSVVLRDPHGLSPGEQAHVVDVAARTEGGRLPSFGELLAAVPVIDLGGLVPSARNGPATTAVIYLFVSPDVDAGGRVDVAQRYADTFFTAPPGGTLAVTGPFAAERTQGRLISDALPMVELGVIAVVVLVVGVRFRSVVAPLVALAAAGLSYVVALRVVGWLGHRFAIGVPGALEPLLVVLLVGVATDYAVFFLAGYRQQVRQGREPRDALCRASGDTIPIIATAGIAVAAATASLVVADLTLFRRLGPGMAVTVLVTMVVAVTFIPAVLAVLGRFALWPSRRARHSGNERDRHRQPGGLRDAMLRRVVHRPVAAVLLLVGAAVLTAGAFPLAHFRLGTNVIADLPASTGPTQALQAAAAGFAPGIVAPTELILDSPGIAGRRGALTQLQRELADAPGVAGVIGPAQQPFSTKVGAVYAPDGDAVRYLLILSDDPYSAAAIAHVADLQQRLPELSDRVGLGASHAGWTGDTVLSEVIVDTTRGDLLRVGLVALGVLLLILIGFLRALLAPVLLLLASVAAVAATLGTTLWLFGAVTGVDGPTFYMPIAVAVLLVAFGSDYNIYLVGRIWEQSEQQPLRSAIVTGGAAASRAIGGAGLALAGSFAMLALVPLNVFRQFAFAMVFGILIDTFFVRTFLVPAGLALVGHWASWPSKRLTGPQHRRRAGEA